MKQQPHAFQQFDAAHPKQCATAYCEEPLDSPVHTNTRTYQPPPPPKPTLMQQIESTPVTTAPAPITAISEDEWESTYASKLKFTYENIEGSRLKVSGPLPEDALTSTFFDPKHRVVAVEDDDGNVERRSLTCLEIRNDETVGLDPTTGQIGLVATTIIVGAGEKSTVHLVEEIKQALLILRKHGLELSGEVRYWDSAPRRIKVEGNSLTEELAEYRWPDGSGL